MTENILEKRLWRVANAVSTRVLLQFFSHLPFTPFSHLVTFCSQYEYHGACNMLPSTRVFVHFVMYLKQQSSIRWFSQILLHAVYESRKEKWIFLYSCLPTETYCKNLVMLEFFSFELWQIWDIFFMKYPLYRLKSYFSGWNLTKLSPLKQHCVALLTCLKTCITQTPKVSGKADLK